MLPVTNAPPPATRLRTAAQFASRSPIPPHRLGASVGFYFKNSRSEALWVAIGLLDTDCGRSEEGGGIDYTKQGWWQVNPGAEVKVWSGWAGGDAWFFYAENASRSLVWAGDYFTDVPDNVFDLCWNIGVGGAARNLGMRRVRPGAEIMDYTLLL